VARRVKVFGFMVVAETAENQTQKNLKMQEMRKRTRFEDAGDEETDQI